MIRNYLKIALRNLAQQKALSFINIVGLSVGLACFSIFLLYAVHEFSYDKFHTNAQRVFRLTQWEEGFPGREPGGVAYGGTPAGPALKNDFPDVESYVRIQKPFDEKLIRIGNNISKNRIEFADASLFSVFSFPILHGDKEALNDPRKIVLTEDAAKKLFGASNVVGRQLEIKNEEQFEPFTVGAVAANLPDNSSIRFGIVGSFNYLMATEMGKLSASSWNIQIGCETYIKLKEGSSLQRDNSKLAAFRHTYFPTEQDEFKKEGTWNGTGPFPISFRMQPLTDIHSNPAIEGMTSLVNPKYIWILIAIATGILLIACINFTTLAIGRSAGRAREVGVRKVMGGNRKELIAQFLTESVLLSFLSAILAWVLATLLLPVFNQLAGVQLYFSFSRFPELAVLLFLLVLITGLLAGIYPSLVLSGFKPLEVLKSRIKLGGANLFTRSLVTFQFVLSIALVIATVIILQQVGYMRSKNLGLIKENVLSVDASGIESDKIYPLFKQELQSGTAILGITGSEMGLGEGAGFMGHAFEYKDEVKGAMVYPVQPGFLKVMGIQLLAGRDFDPQIASDTTSSIIVNEAFLRDFDIKPASAIGHQLMEKRFGSENVSRTIVGVIKNFNYNTLSENVRPQFFIQPPALRARSFFIRLKPGDPASGIAATAAAWKKLVPGVPFQYSFLDENINRFYKSEQRWSSIVGTAGAVCIFLACLGLFGLAALTAANRTREIGIRKVLGASVLSIVRLIAKDFLKLVLIALCIAIPIAWWGMYKWLQDYAYRIHISGWVFAATALAALSIAFLTVGIKAIGTAVANPTRSLRSE